MARTTKEFRSAYEALNSQQKQAVDSTDGPVMVVAGPGTGKTQTIALRIANILLKTDTNPDAILALTFTESGARAMRSRLVSLIGHSAYYVSISTFHSFCIDVIRDHPDYFTIDPSSEPLSELEKLKLVHSLLDQSRYQAIKPANSPYHYARAILRSISDLKREGFSPKDFKKVIAQEEKKFDAEKDNLSKSVINSTSRNLAKNQDLLKIFYSYETTLQELKSFDFDDMINHVVHAFKDNKDLLLDYQERYQYFLVDEYQDTNRAQNQVVDLLASHWGDQANVFVVGDPDQAIYRFQGASVENMMSFLTKYLPATTITLKDNYRSTQSLLDAAHSLISHNNMRIDDLVEGADLHLQAKSAEDNLKTTLLHAPSQLTESIYIADTIRKFIKSGTSPDEIAVIYRNNADAKSLADIFVKFNIDYVIQGGGNVLEDSTIQQLLKILRVIHDLRTKQDDLNLFTILHYDIFSVNPLDVLKLSRKASETKATLFDIIENTTLLKDLKLANQSALEKVLDQLATWQRIDANSTFVSFFESVLNDSGFLSWILVQPDAHNKLSKINTLFSEIKRMNSANHSMNLSDFLLDLNLMEANRIRVEDTSFAVRSDAITLTTAHSAKGLEWEHVFIYKAYDGQWGNNRTRELIKLPSSLLATDLSKKEKNEDERRLFYVALTRAKHHAHITLSQSYHLYGKSKQVIPAMFLEEIGEENINAIPLDSSTEEISKQIEKILQSKPPIKPNKSEQAYLKKLVDKFSLSVTSLNTYLECAYKFKLNNLLKVPRAKASYLAFGTAVHTTLEQFYTEFKENSSPPSKDFLLQSFEVAIKKEILTDTELTERLEQGRIILSAYYNLYLDDFQEALFLEKFSRVQLDDITLTGKIDRIEWEDESDRTVKVVDYKTGKPKTKGQIMGTTQDSRGNLHRQLVFYRLLIDLDRRLKVNFGQAELDFVQSPADKKKPGKFRFPVTDQEISDLKKTIKQVMQGIRSLDFPRTTDHTNCTRCEFKDHCYPQGIPNS